MTRRSLAWRALRRARTVAFRATNPGLWRTIQAVRERNLTYIEPPELANLASLARTLDQPMRAGIILEAGCALGGSAIVLASARRTARPVHVYDVFGMIPPPGDADGPDVQARYALIASGQSSGIGGDRYYGYESNLYERVVASFRAFNLPPEQHHIRLVQGLFQDTLRLDEPVLLAHLDCDWYDSVMTCLQAIEPRLVPGGALVVDDYDFWSGCRRAVDEYFDTRGRDGFHFVHHGAHLVIRRRD